MLYSNEMTNVRAGSLNDTQVSSGKLRIAEGNFNTGEDGTLSGNTIELFTLPAGAKVVDGVVSFEAMGTGAEIQIGVKAFDETGYIDKDGSIADDEDFFMDSTTVSGAGVDTIANLVQGDTNADYQFEKNVIVTAEVDGSEDPAWAADKDLKVRVLYITD